MKKKIIIIGVVLIGFMMALTSNSWALRERGGDRRPDRSDQFQPRNGSGDRDFDRQRIRDRGSRNHFGQHFNRPGPRFKPKFHRRHHYRAPYRHGPKFWRWRHRPVYRHGHPGRFYRRPYHSVVKEINHYYSSAESYSEPEDEFAASATITDSGFSVFVGVKETN
ncbi:MAG: hypothetical protein PVG15_15295 [Desulfobacterales bacterium]